MDLKVALEERFCDESSMALPRDLLRAHERASSARRVFLELDEARGKGVAFLVLLVVDIAVTAEALA